MKQKAKMIVSLRGTGRFTTRVWNRLKHSTVFPSGIALVRTTLAPWESQVPRSPKPAPHNGNLHV